MLRTGTETTGGALLRPDLGGGMAGTEDAIGDIREDAPAGASMEPSRFLVDRTLGRLVRWLRLLGYDTVWDRFGAPAAVLARAAEEDRVVLTRDTLLVERRPVRRGHVRAVLVRADLLAEQLQQLRSEEGLRRRGEPRCLVCNGRLELRAPYEVRERVPRYVAQTQTRFTYCPTCDRVTWPATHWDNMQRTLDNAGF